MTGFKSKKTAALDEDGMYLVHQTEHSENNLKMVQPAQEPTLQKQLNIANAGLRKARAGLRKAGAGLRKANAEWDKAKAEIKRIETLMEQTHD